jgi:adenosylmethionine-8-amino-7-oxononanoate aminotransferase
MSDSKKEYVLTRPGGGVPSIAKGSGVYVWDEKGKMYIDGSSGPVCVNIGHGVKEITDAVKDQMEKISYMQNPFFVTDSARRCAEKIVSLTPKGLENVFFCSGGSEATEASIKMSRQFHIENGEPTRYKVISRWQSYHGNTLGSLSVSGNIARRSKYVPLLIDFPHIPPAYCYRCWYGKKFGECDLECARGLELMIKATGPKYVSAFIAEPIVGATLGTVPAPVGYFEIIKEICEKYGVLFIADEVQTGLGRTGKNWGLDHYGVIPDILCTAKGLASGYLPLGATIASNKVYDVFSESFSHGHTYGSHPVTCAAGVACLEYMEKHNLVERSQQLGKYFHKELEKLYAHESVGDIRGIGLFSGIEFVQNKETKEAFHPDTRYNNRVVEACFENGLIVYPGIGTIDGIYGDHIQVAPPLVVSKEQIDDIIAILGKSMTQVEEQIL